MIITRAAVAEMTREQIVAEITKVEMYLTNCTNILDAYGNISALNILRDELDRRPEGSDA